MATTPLLTPGRVAGLLGLVLLMSAVFTLVHGQAPLYYSNQNQYFLHGLASAGFGELHSDWLANTIDPTPIFSGLVAVTARGLPPWVFHVYHALLGGVYTAAVVGIFFVLAGDGAKCRWPVFVALFLLVHSAVARWCSYRWFGQDYPWYFHTGVAAQYILGPILQPSAFGVFLVAGVALFASGRVFGAAVAVVAAVTMHPTYLLPAAMLTVGFMAHEFFERRPLKALGVGGLTLLLVLPTVVSVLMTFGPTSAELFAESQRILVDVRIPHHSRVDLWLDVVAGLQIGWVVLGTVLAWRTRLFLVLAVPFVIAVLLTLLQTATGNHGLGLMFPWRVSAVLVPVATTVILSRLVAVRRLPLDGWPARTVSGVVVIGLTAGGVWVMATRQAFLSSDEELPLMAWVRDHHQPGEVYFLPVQVPDLLKKPRGSASSDFQPMKEKKADPRMLPSDLHRFRLHTGVPVYVDFKAIPYKDVDVIEWHRRLRVSEEVQKQLREGETKAALATLRNEGVTHLVLPPRQELREPGAEQVAGHLDYCRVYRLVPPPADAPSP